MGFNRRVERLINKSRLKVTDEMKNRPRGRFSNGKFSHKDPNNTYNTHICSRLITRMTKKNPYIYILWDIKKSSSWVAILYIRLFIIESTY